MVRTVLSAALVLVLAACTSTDGAGSQPPEATGEDPVGGDVTCGASAFDLDVLRQPGLAELGLDPASAALRNHLGMENVETDWLPDSGWIEVARTGDFAEFVAPGEPAEWFFVTVEVQAADWAVTTWGECRLEAAVAPGTTLALFRVAPGEVLTPETVEVDVLVTETACNSGQDARGRILPPAISTTADSVTVVMSVQPRGGAQECPSNPETPFVLLLPEPLGDRMLLDGSEVPPRDATVCPESLCP